MDAIALHFRRFLNKYWDGRPFLLGLSGGPDSTLLFHLLIETAVPFKVAHVNHRWRSESDREAFLLREKAKERGIEFFEKVLDPSLWKNNFEDRAREERLSFFKELYQEHSFQALLLAHHADDLAETVLKRLFEGASLHHLHGLSAISAWGGMPIFRPLLEIKKSDIVAALEKRKIAYFVDKTNLDAKFLRGRFRKELFPMLSESFGKNISPSLCRLANSSKELSQFLEKVITPFRSRISHSPQGAEINFSDANEFTAFEVKLAIRDFFESFKITPSSSQIEAIFLHLIRKSAHKELVIGNQRVSIHHGQLTLPRNPD